MRAGAPEKRTRKAAKADLRVYFQGEAWPRIADGERGVTVLSVGPKWARIEETATGQRATLPRAKWEALAAHAARREDQVQQGRAKIAANRLIT